MIEYRNVIPVVLKAPFFTQISSTFVKISMQTQDKAIIYGIILLQSNSNINPNSFQISQVKKKKKKREINKNIFSS
jgi:hypothetical protein